MKILSFILFASVLFLLTAETKITFKPFSVRFETLTLAVGVILLWAGALLIENHFYDKGQKDMLNKIKKFVNEMEVKK